jgi:hypothetical protein
MRVPGADPLQPLAAVQLDRLGQTFERVDLPVPLRPTRQVRSASVSVTPSVLNSGRNER